MSVPDRSRQVEESYHQREAVSEEEAHLTGKQSKLREQQAALMKTDGSRQARRAHNQEASDGASLYLSLFFFFFPLSSSQRGDELMLGGSITEESNLATSQPRQRRCRCHETTDNKLSATPQSAGVSTRARAHTHAR